MPTNTKVNIDQSLKNLLKEPELYDVVILNDDFTTMEFVVEVLIKIFYKGESEAEKIMLDVHQKGSGTVGQYTLDIATSKVERATALARASSFPLRFKIKLH